MNLSEFTTNIKQQIQQHGLPDHTELIRRVSPTRLNSKISPSANFRKSAVLILFYPKGEDVYVPLILRPQYDGVHGGQMAFPGGRVEPKDLNIQKTALREAQEEIGIKASDVKIIDNITEIYIPPSNMFCQPVLGYLNYKPDFYPDEREVAKIFEVSITELQKPDIFQIREIESNGKVFQTPCFLIQGQIVWGATALMIAELLEIINKK